MPTWHMAWTRGGPERRPMRPNSWALVIERGLVPETLVGAKTELDTSREMDLNVHGEALPIPLIINGSDHSRQFIYMILIKDV